MVVGSSMISLTVYDRPQNFREEQSSFCRRSCLFFSRVLDSKTNLMRCLILVASWLGSALSLGDSRKSLSVDSRTVCTSNCVRSVETTESSFVRSISELSRCQISLITLPLAEANNWSRWIDILLHLRCLVGFICSSQEMSLRTRLWDKYISGCPLRRSQPSTGSFWLLVSRYTGPVPGDGCTQWGKQ